MLRKFQCQAILGPGKNKDFFIKVGTSLRLENNCFAAT